MEISNCTYQTICSKKECYCISYNPKKEVSKNNFEKNNQINKIQENYKKTNKANTRN